MCVISRPSSGIAGRGVSAAPSLAQATPQHGLVGVDHRLAQPALDVGDGVDLRGVGAGEEYALDLRPVVLLGKLGPLRRRDIAEVERLELQRHVAHDLDAGGVQVIDDGLVAVVGREQHDPLQGEHLERLQHQPAGGDRIDAGDVAHDVEDFAFALRSLRHRGVGAVEDDQVRRAVGQELRRGRDLARHLRQRPFPGAGDARPRDVDSQIPGREPVELRLAEGVDRRDDEPDATVRERVGGGVDGGGDIHGRLFPGSDRSILVPLPGKVLGTATLLGATCRHQRALRCTRPGSGHFPWRGTALDRLPR